MLFYNGIFEFHLISVMFHFYLPLKVSSVLPNTASSFFLLSPRSLSISMPPPCPTVTLSPRSRASWSVITAWPGPHQKVRPKSSLLLPSIMAYFLKHGSTEIRNWSSMNENSSCNCKTSLPYFGVKLSVCQCLLIERKVMTYSYPKVT